MDKVNILILYHSKSGKTEKISQLIENGASKGGLTNVIRKSIFEADEQDLVWADGMAVGFPTHLGSVSGEMKSWFDNTGSIVWGKVNGKIAIPFTSVGSVGGGGELALSHMHIILQNFGFFTFGTTNWSGPKHSFHYGTVIAGEPRSESEINAAVMLGEELQQWTVKFYSKSVNPEKYRGPERSM